MSKTLRSIALVSILVSGAAAASAQSNSSTPSSSDESTRPATTTFFGDTGIWFVPTAEVLPAGKWSASAYRRGTNFVQGYSNVADFAGTFAFGIKDRAEVFGSFLVDTRIDRDLRPLFGTEADFGGIIPGNPRVNTGWTGDNVGDLYLGVKFNLWSESRRNPAAIAVRGMVKVPTGKKDAGVSTGKADGSVAFIVSKELARAAELSGTVGYEARGSADGFSTPGGYFQWGAGASFPSRSMLRGFAEINGGVPSGSTSTITGASLVATDFSVAPTISNTASETRATVGLNFQARNGFFLGAGLSWNLPQRDRLTGRREADDDPSTAGDYVDYQFRIGFHPGARVYVAPPPPPPPPPPPAPAPVAAPTHNLAVKADCNPCTVQVGQNSTVTATAQDSISCALTYRWSAPAGTFANAAVRETQWTAPQQAGAVPITVTVTCPTDNKTASDTVRIQVNAPPPPVVELTFEDVFFDFDRYSLRPEALRLLDDAVAKLQANAGKNMVIEGHTCSIGTAEYNLALGERRAAAVRDYLVSRGVPVSRLETRSYGEERPKYDNAREETRRLNRRAALVVKVQ